MHYEEIEHTADWAFRVRGRDLKELFRNAALALSSIGQRQPLGRGRIAHEIEVQGADRETLLVNWLNELLYHEQTAGEAYDRIEILEISDQRLRARVEGALATDPQSLIKAVTFHNLEVQQTAEGFEATLVLDV